MVKSHLNGTKKCNICLSLKPLDEFAKCKTSPDKRQYRCRPCNTELARYYRKQNGMKPKRQRDPNTPSGMKECFDCDSLLSLSSFSPTSRGWRGVSAYCKPCQNTRAKKNRPQHAAYVRKWRRGNERWRVQHAEHQHRRRAQTGERVAHGTLAKLYKEESCYYCNAKTPRVNRTIDHKIPLSRGGLHAPQNLVMACGSCNSKKHALTEEEFRRKMAW